MTSSTCAFARQLVGSSAVADGRLIDAYGRLFPLKFSLQCMYIYICDECVSCGPQSPRKCASSIGRAPRTAASSRFFPCLEVACFSCYKVHLLPPAVEQQDFGPRPAGGQLQAAQEGCQRSHEGAGSRHVSPHIILRITSYFQLRQKKSPMCKRDGTKCTWLLADSQPRHCRGRHHGC